MITFPVGKVIYLITTNGTDVRFHRKVDQSGKQHSPLFENSAAQGRRPKHSSRRNDVALICYCVLKKGYVNFKQSTSQKMQINGKIIFEKVLDKI